MSQARYLSKLASVLSAEGVIPTSKGGTGNTTGAGNSPTISAIVYPGNDTAVNTAGGDTVTLTGANFNTGVSVIVNGVPASVVTRVSSSEITFTTSAQAAGSYIIYVVNTDGSTGLAVPGLQYSGVPSWTTAAGSLATVYETAAISNSLSASSDSAVTYSVESGTLPTGVTLFAGSGLVSGTAPVVESSTTYNFTVTASDGENQDTARNFSYTVNPDVVTWSSPSSGATLSGTVGTAYTQSLSATSAAGQAITYTADALPAGLNISGSSITGTPTAASSISTLLTATAATTQKTATRTFNWNIITLTYTITPASSSVNEGSALTFNVGGTNITNGTYYWSINNTTTAAGDFSASTGSFTITNNVGSFTVTATADATLEGAQTFTVSLRTGSVSGTIVATSSTVTINDTSTAPPVGQAAYTTAGTFSWTAPAGVTSVSVVAVGPGGKGYGIAMPNEGGGGGGLGWTNNIAVTPGNSYTVVVGAAGSGTHSYFISTATVRGGAGGDGTATTGGAGGTYTGTGGGNGGAGGTSTAGSASGGGGAGGYAGAGGKGAGSNDSSPYAGVAGSGGGGAGGALGSPVPGGGGGGGVGILGQGSNGVANAAGYDNGSLTGYQGGGGSGGGGTSTTRSRNGGNYGGGSAGHQSSAMNNYGAGGAVRIIWGPGRAFPSTLTTDQ